MAISFILEQTVNQRIRDYFSKGKVPFSILSITVDGSLLDIIQFPDGLPEGSANLYIWTNEDAPRSELTLTLPVELKL